MGKGCEALLYKGGKPRTAQHGFARNDAFWLENTALYCKKGRKTEWQQDEARYEKAVKIGRKEDMRHGMEHETALQGGLPCLMSPDGAENSFENGKRAGIAARSGAENG